MSALGQKRPCVGWDMDFPVFYAPMGRHPRGPARPLSRLQVSLDGARPWPLLGAISRSLPLASFNAVRPCGEFSTLLRGPRRG